MDTDTRYFEPTSRVQLASKLRHLLRFSDLMTLIIGEDGSGRSTLLKQLQVQSHEGEIREGVIHCDGAVDVTRLLQLLVDAFNIDCPPGADNRQRLKELHELSRTLHESGIPLVLLIDDADYLTNNALELLTNFALLEDAAPRVVLTGTPDFEQRFLSNELDQLLDGRLHVQVLGSFDEDEAEEFIESLLPNGAVLQPRRMKALIDQSEAYPGRLYRLVQNELHAGNVHRTATRRAFPFPLTHMLAIAVVLLVIFGGALWLFLPDTSVEEDEASVARVELPLDITVASNDREPEVVEVRSELQKRLEEQEARLSEGAESETGDADAQPLNQAAASPQPAPNPVAPVTEGTGEASGTQDPPSPQPSDAPTGGKVEDEAEAPEESKAENEPVKAPEKPAEKPALASKDSKAEASHPMLRADELLEWPDEGYTLQLLGARSADSVERFINAQAQPERFYYFETMYKGAPWHVVVYGQFANRASAMAAVETLPEALRKLRPWARSIAGVKSDIRK